MTNVWNVKSVEEFNSREQRAFSRLVEFLGSRQKLEIRLATGRADFPHRIFECCLGKGRQTEHRKTG